VTKAPQQPLATVAVLGAGGDDQDLQQQPAGVHGNLAFAAMDLLGGVIALGSRGTQSLARTDWESITAAVGATVRPAALRTRPRSIACSRARVPSAAQWVKW
jgi:hypothetical protein